MNYLKYIDGLRSLSVLAVIFYHYDMFQMSGGFVGVDVFFVISGFLICLIIMKDIELERYSVTDFWARRIRRIVPAFLLVVIMTFVAGWFVLLPLDYMELSQSVAANALFASNIFFWKQTGYFNTSAELLPLLHTWSLAVEMQFYIFFPFFIWFLARKVPDKLTLMLALVCVVSFAINVVGVQYRPAAAFYLLPTRGWELGVGALVALSRKPVFASAWVKEVLGIAGLAAIGYAVFFYNSQTVFPGVAALLPCLGAAAIIWSNKCSLNAVGRLLSLSPLVFIGLLSYSLYLWHWPLVSLTRYTSFDVNAIETKLALLAISFCASYVSWRFVETYFRTWRMLSTPKATLASCVLGLSVLMALGAAGQVYKGIPSRIPTAALDYHNARNDHHPLSEKCHDMSPDDLRAGKLCQFGPDRARPDLVTFGDSHADALLPVIKSLAEEYGVTVWHASRSSCPPLLNFDRIDKGPEFKCLQGADAFFDMLKEHDLKKVMLVSNWRSSVNGRYVHVAFGDEEATNTQDAQELYEKAFAQTFDTLKKMGVSGWILEQTPFHEREVPNYLARKVMEGADPDQVTTAFSHYREETSFVNQLVRGIAGRVLVPLKPQSLLCPQGQPCKMAANGQALYRDNNHLSQAGALFLRPVLEPAFKSLSE